MRIITLEEHFITESFVRATGAPRFAELQPKLLNLGAGGIADMDEAGINLQVLSLASMGFDALDVATATALAHDVNDELADAVRAHPDRLAGFAMVAFKDSNVAAAELDRCVTRLGFAGALVDGTTGGLFLDDACFLPFFEAAAHLNVPVYLHPAPPPDPVRQAYGSFQRCLVASGTAPPPTSRDLLPEQYPHHYQRVLYPSAFAPCAGCGGSQPAAFLG
jgi:uncharacterized protein